MTLAELKKLFGEQPALFQEVLGHIATTTEGKELLENYANQKLPAKIGEKTSEIYNGIDKDIRDFLGEEKPTDKKTYEFLKEKFTELKELRENKGKTPGDDPKSAEKITQLEKELGEIKEKNWEGKYNTLVSETSTKVGELTTEIQSLKEGSTSSLVNIELATGLSNLKINPNIPKEASDAMTDVIKQRVLKTAKVVEGKVVYYKEDGTPYLDELYKPITAEGIFKTELKSILVGVGNSGGGADNTEKGKVVTIVEGDTTKKRVNLDPTKFNTKLAFAQHAEEVLLENGVEKNSKEWNDIVQEARTEYGVDKMDRM